MNPQEHKYFKLIFFIAVAYLIFLLIKPFISIVLGSVVLSYAFYPVYKRINTKVKNEHLCSALTTIIIFLIILLPLIFVLNVLTVESISAYQTIKSQDFSKFTTTLLDEKFSTYIQEIINRVLLFFVEVSSKLVLSIPSIALNFFLLFFLIYYLLKDGKIIAENLKAYLPFSNKQEIYTRFDKLTRALIYGTILIAIIQGIAGGLGFLIFKIPSAILWGFAMGVASFIPLVGTAIIWLPAGIFKLIQGDLVSGIGIILFGALIVGSIDNLVRPYLVSAKAKVHPAVVLLGVLGGLKLFGFTGIIIGPLFLALALEFIRVKTT
ncbi:MAG: AI-2E family transporter [Nanoarchaeota archaeon]|nr:AI-2E family transporter [Nanoarchaeota archaeon]